MSAGGKNLRCDLSVRAESTAGTLAVLGPSLRDFNELPSPTTASSVGTQSSCVSTSGIKHERGSTRGIALLKARTGGKLTVNIPDGRIGGCTEIECTSSVQFQRRRVLEHPYPEMNKKNRLVSVIYSRSAINQENRAKLKIVHASGARSVQRMKALLKNPKFEEINPSLLYKKRTLIKMACGHQKMHGKILKKWRHYSCNTSQRKSHTHKWRFLLRYWGRKRITCEV
ncbi:hypothetical protein CJ030_MR1G004840 [Morella rubra]|uniref:Uncharacterized protein n=1 Tax=Morella rubra TaxID=262757 RepID=A0A6A1WRI2_9ROSI|nr:hypothetical protein CJ030_MR1G004840 [Morella rubra]